jgi:hypothetical protein
MKLKLDEVANSNAASEQLTTESLKRLESLVSEICMQQRLSFGSLESSASKIESLMSAGSGQTSPLLIRRHSSSLQSGNVSPGSPGQSPTRQQGFVPLDTGQAKGSYHTNRRNSFSRFNFWPRTNPSTESLPTHGFFQMVHLFQPLRQ